MSSLNDSIWSPRCVAAQTPAPAGDLLLSFEDEKMATDQPVIWMDWAEVPTEPPPYYRETDLADVEAYVRGKAAGGLTEAELVAMLDAAMLPADGENPPAYQYVEPGVACMEAWMRDGGFETSELDLEVVRCQSMFDALTFGLERGVDEGDDQWEVRMGLCEHVLDVLGVDPPALDPIYTSERGDELWHALPLWVRSRDWTGCEVVVLGSEDGRMHGGPGERILVRMPGREGEKDGIILWGPLEALLHVIVKLEGERPDPLP